MLRPGSSLSKQRKRAAVPGGGKPGAAGPVTAGTKKRTDAKPDLMAHLERCDFVGAKTILSFDKRAKVDRTGGTNMWLAYAAFHNGDYRESLDAYEEVLAKHASMGKSYCGDFPGNRVN